MKAVNVVKTAVWIALLAGFAAAQLKYVAVVETEIDASSGATADLSSAEAREITAELRREAVKNLPRGKYNIMTSETVQAQGGAVLEECAEENCVITLGSKIGADYIVRGIIRRFKTQLTLTVEIYETEDGNLVASSDPVRSENAAELLAKTAAVCAEMYKKFESEQTHAQKTAPTPPQPAVAAPKAAVTSETSARQQKADDGGGNEAAAKRNKSMKSLSLGFNQFNFSPSGDGQGHIAAQLGIGYFRPIAEVVSLNVEGNILAGEAYMYGEMFGFFGLNVPLTALFQWGFFSLEAGVDGGVVFGYEATAFNAGFVAGAGFRFATLQLTITHLRCFYRYCGGVNYGAHVIGVQGLF